MRKGMLLGSGKKGYYNLIPRDSYIHSLSARGIKSYSIKSLPNWIKSGMGDYIGEMMIDGKLRKLYMKTSSGTTPYPAYYKDDNGNWKRINNNQISLEKDVSMNAKKCPKCKENMTTLCNYCGMYLNDCIDKKNHRDKSWHCGMCDITIQKKTKK